MSILDSNLEKLLKGLGTPLEVSVCPEAEAAADYGSQAVSGKVRSHGGELVSGWWLHDMKKYVELEFLCVWKSADGDMIDITDRKSNNSECIVFFPSAVIKYEGLPIDNIRINFRKDALVDYLFNIEEHIFALLKTQKAGQSGLTGIADDDRDYIFLKGERSEVAGFINEAKDAGSGCFCGSGQTFSECHLSNGEDHTNFIVNKYDPLIRAGTLV